MPTDHPGQRRGEGAAGSGEGGAADRGQEGPASPELGRPQEVRIEHRRPARSRLWYLLLLPSYIGLLWVPFYARAEPTLLSFPFFYWFQFAWVPITALLTYVVYRRVR